MRVVRLGELLGGLEGLREDLGSLACETVRALAEELTFNTEDEWGVFSLDEVLDMLARGSPIGAHESDALELLENAFRNGPLGQRIEKKVEEKLLIAEELSLEDIVNDILVLLERGSSGELTPVEAEVYATLKDLIHKEAEELSEKLIEKSEGAVDKWGLFSLDKVVGLLERGAPIGTKESDALERFERAVRVGPLGQRIGKAGYHR